MRCRWTKADWKTYMNDEAGGRQALEMETHLSQCSSCMQVYERVLLESMESLERAYGQAPDLIEPIMKQIVQAQAFVQTRPAHQVTQHSKHSPHTKRRAFVHYAIAAAMALLFLSAGLFEKTVFYAEQSQHVLQESEQWVLNFKTLKDEWLTDLSHLFKAK